MAFRCVELNRMATALYNSSAGSMTETIVYDIYGNKQSVANVSMTDDTLNRMKHTNYAPTLRLRVTGNR